MTAGPPVKATERALSALVTAMTQKDEPMDWKQIETKWAAMALRICADAHSGEINASVRSERSAGKGETTRNVVAKQVAAKQVLAKQIAVVGSESTQELNTVSTR